MLGCNRFNKLLQSRRTERDKSSNSTDINIKFILLFCSDDLYECYITQLFAALDFAHQILRQ